jgi:hypothetical protein
LEAQRRFFDPVRLESGREVWERRTVGEKPYHIIGKEEIRELTKFPAKNRQALPPMVELIEEVTRKWNAR